MKESIQLITESFGEPMMMRWAISPIHKEKDLISIGKVEDMKSKYKNDLFKNIYVDEDGIIYDVRYVEKKPTDEELENYVEYWNELVETFGKKVEPVFIIYGDNQE